MMRIYNICVIVLIGGLLTGCGFQPIYGNQDARQQLKQIRIDPINDRLGQMLRNQLLELQGGQSNVPVKYALSSDVVESTSELSVTRDDEVTLANLVVTLSYTLTDISSGSMVSQGTLKGQTSYDLIDSPFADINSDRQAKRALAQSLAQRLSIRLSSALNRTASP